MASLSLTFSQSHTYDSVTPAHVLTALQNIRSLVLKADLIGWGLLLWLFNEDKMPHPIPPKGPPVLWEEKLI